MEMTNRDVIRSERGPVDKSMSAQADYMTIPSSRCLSAGEEGTV